ncbi:hypothetical protein D3C75_1062010 [compost metagenome]
MIPFRNSLQLRPYIILDPLQNPVQLGQRRLVGGQLGFDPAVQLQRFFVGGVSRSQTAYEGFRFPDAEQNGLHQRDSFHQPPCAFLAGRRLSALQLSGQLGHQLVGFLDERAELGGGAASFKNTVHIPDLRQCHFHRMYTFPSVKIV